MVVQVSCRRFPDVFKIGLGQWDVEIDDFGRMTLKLCFLVDVQGNLFAVPTTAKGILHESLFVL